LGLRNNFSGCHKEDIVGNINTKYIEFDFIRSRRRKSSYKNWVKLENKNIFYMFDIFQMIKFPRENEKRKEECVHMLKVVRIKNVIVMIQSWNDVTLLWA
jgi:hypothetical protein